MDSDGEYQVPSNVTRIARAIKPLGTDRHGEPIAQVIFYQNGVGTGSSSMYVKYVGGATGGGLAANIREAYSFICQNYNRGDEIFLLGFSRGAFTARSIASLIRAVGLLTSTGLESFYSIFEDWQNQNKKGWKSKYHDYPWPGHAPPVTSEAYQRKMLELELTRPGIPIKCVAVWDTVGGLGIPMVGLLPQLPSSDFSFVDTKVEPNVEYAFQALALDEHRRSYAPTVWERPEGQAMPRKLKQTWFPGVHSDIGGSYADTDLANVTLCWMVSQLDGLIDFELNYVWKQVRLGIERHEKALQEKEREEKKDEGHKVAAAAAAAVRAPPPTPRPWGLGRIHNSMTAFFRLGGSQVRTPGEYRESELADQHGTLYFMASKLGTRLSRHNTVVKPRLKNTGETFHSSVRIRMGKKGKGYDDKGLYDSSALEGWVMAGDVAEPDTPHQITLPGQAGAMKNVVWRKKVRKVRRGSGSPKRTSIDSVSQVGGDEDDQDDNAFETIAIPEDEMGTFERMVLQLWPEINKDFDAITPGGHGQEITKRSFTDPPHATGGYSGREELPPLPEVPMLRVDGAPPSRRRSVSSRAGDDGERSDGSDGHRERHPERADTY